ncbi:S-layer homology domain-containing protein [Rubeoparvulum massiliense]|uniref:S-layer homology domain-containing protein n=1 Tax=Rubeoparvulum massiliense TaxID=1631346 RepID=UPI00065E0EA6|nr:S-layer homology domain-containing protein [Rubeoparvulum massiliense]
MKKQIIVLLLMIFLIAPQVNAESALTDINGHWAESNIQNLVGLNIISGYPDSTFRPDQNISRAAFVKILIIASENIEKYDTTLEKSVFNDVSQSYWGYPYIMKAVEKGIIIPSDYPNSSFSPDTNITRLEMAMMVSRLLGNDTNTLQAEFTDNNQIPAYALKNVSLVVNKGIIQGFPDGSFAPYSPATRAQATVIIERYLNHISQNSSNLSNPTDPKIENPVDKGGNAELSAKDIVARNDNKVVLIKIFDEAQREISGGSGVFVKEGILVTNYHVIEGASYAVINTVDNSTYAIEGVVAYDPEKDLALIKTTTLPKIAPVTIGNAGKLSKGDKIITIGSPYGLKNTVSEGLVSGFRNDGYVDLIQINAPIDHGSSGGGLFNTRGELVGITSSGNTTSVADLNFAIPINYINSWLSDLTNKRFANIASTSLADFNPSQVNYEMEEVNEENLQRLSDILTEYVSVIETSEGNIYLSQYDAFFLDDNSTIGINAAIDLENYKFYITNFDAIYEDLSNYAYEMGTFFNEVFPNKNYSFILFFQDYSSIFPSVFDPSDYDYIPEKDSWLITHAIIKVAKIDGQFYGDILP